MADVIAYSALDAPEAERWIAFLFQGKARLPVAFPARTKELAVRSAEAFWTAEVAKDAARQKLKAERSEKMRRVRTDPLPQERS